MLLHSTKKIVYIPWYVLSNEILCIIVPQKAAKVVVRICRLSCIYNKIFLFANFDLLQFCCPLSHMNAQYLIWKSLQILSGIRSSQEHSSTFKMCNICSKCLHFNSTYLSLYFWQSFLETVLPIKYHFVFISLIEAEPG